MAKEMIPPPHGFNYFKNHIHYHKLLDHLRYKRMLKTKQSKPLTSCFTFKGPRPMPIGGPENLTACGAE
eukprot:scaffold40309_cov18-Prasinocladus_malaysianus.AAC.1